jgi:cellobiose phosphorylase
MAIVNGTETRERAPRWTFRRTEDAGEHILRVSLLEEPIRASLLSLDQLADHARTLADWHQLAPKPRRNRLLAQLEENAHILAEAYRLLSRSAANDEDIPPAGNWFLDNYYLALDQIRMARQHLPRKYNLELPHLVNGLSAGLPRVYDLALELIGHVDGQVDEESLYRFIGAYQSTSVLKLGELWAIPIMIRLALIENLRRLVLRIMRQKHEEQQGEQWADRIIVAARQSFGELVRCVSDLVSSEPALTPAFVARFAHRLTGRLPKDTLATQWLDQQLAEAGQSIESLVNQHSQAQAADQISISHCIVSLRELGALDWKKFVESQSAVERILRQDPAGVYATMDFTSRDRYRHVVESLARQCALNEQQVARMAIESAQMAPTAPKHEAAARGPTDKRRHVGFHLVDEGRPQLEDRVGYRRSVRERLARMAGRVPLTCYLTAMLLVWLLVVVPVVAMALRFGPTGLGAVSGLVVVLALFAAAATQFALSMVNWLATLQISPRGILRLDFSEGIPRDHRTLVAVPTMIGDARSARKLVDQLELRFLANQDENLLFALLTDFPDSATETRADDEVVLAVAQAGIERLNQQYDGDGPGRFFLLHRPRRFNPQEEAWMAVERKRGKLEALNGLLRTGATEPFSTIVGDLGQLGSVRYVITLDTDTALPRDVGRELAGCMAHPLNRPKIDPRTGVVVEGYAVLQPRVATTIPEAEHSLYSRLFAGDPGIDPYTSEVSDVYQDVFGEGSFIGKGIYDVHAFETALRGRFPANRILSHDLIEGCFVRSGLVDDVELFEGFPSRFLADMSRRHRWIRGDWQIAAWIARRTPSARGAAANPLSALSRWKIFDNLRRSLVPVFLVAMLLLGWWLLPGMAALWTGLALLLTFGSTLISEAPPFFRRPQDVPWALHLREQARQLAAALARETIGLAVLPYVVHCNLDAIARTTYRLSVSRKRLLEWTTASDAQSRARGNIRIHYEVMWANTVLALSIGALLAITAPAAVPYAWPLLGLWLMGPGIAWRVSRSRSVEVLRVSPTDTAHMRRWARRTWHFFETHVTEADHWLAPDNIQLFDEWTVSPRTSPTNIGLGLLADLAGYDMGYLPAVGLLDRVDRTLRTMARLERYRGHFFNWYDTRSLRPSEPRYVSSVDSGNLWGALVVLRAGLVELRQKPLVAPRLLEGLQDTLAVVAAARGTARGDEFDARLRQLEEECAGPYQGGARRAWGLLNRVSHMAAELAHRVPADSHDVRDAIAALLRQGERAQQELGRLAFWVRVPHLPEAVYSTLSPAVQQAFDRLREQIDRLDSHSTLGQLPDATDDTIAQATALVDALGAVNGDIRGEHQQLRVLLVALIEGGELAAAAARDALGRIDELLELIDEFAAIDFRFLFHPEKKLLSIGFNVTEHRRDNSYYDLLASEARLASFLGISHRQLPQEHWFALGRMVTLAEGSPTLLSWSGSMFEYLMPLLFMPHYPGTSLEVSCRGAVRRQIRYCRRRGVPWGISESCYNLSDTNLAYRYRAFGVPGLGLERGQGNHLVIAPYASALAVMVTPHEACANLSHLESRGYSTRYGFYDALDYTPQRRASADEPAVCLTIMAHHSAMTLLSFTNVLLQNVMQRRFMTNRLCRAHDLLLQERLPRALRPVDPTTLDLGPSAAESGQVGRSSLRVFDTPHTALPEVHLLSNGRYHVILTNGGGGMSRCGDLAVTRWQADAATERGGMFTYLRDVDTGRFWSNAYLPTLRTPDKYVATFSQGQVEYRMIHDEIDTQTQVSVSPEDDVEVRRLAVTNLSRVTRTIELTSYAEIVLTPADADRAHRAFSSLFVETELRPEADAILATRRPRNANEPRRWMFHLVNIQAAKRSAVTFETSRQRFVGRMRTLENPAAMDADHILSGTQGAVLDPIVSLRQSVTLESEETAIVHWITGVVDTREQALAAIMRYHDPRLAARVFDLSRAHSQLNLQQLNMTEADAQLYAHLASAVLYPESRYRSGSTLIHQQLRPQSALWAMGISGDRPIALVRCSDRQRSRLVEQMLNAHAYWQSKGLAVDLVIWVDTEPGYRQELYDQVMGLIAFGPRERMLDQPGGVYVRRGDEHPIEGLRALEAAARIVLNDESGPLENQVKPTETLTVVRGERTRVAARRAPRREHRTRTAPDLLFFNGLGGFTRDGREYITIVSPDHPTPAPWCNVLANPHFGAVVSESGAGYTWCRNSHQYRLTPWSNDAVSDPPAEVIYIRDEESGEMFSATPLPCPSPEGALCRHGFGYTVWETGMGDIEAQLWCFVAVDQPLKFFLLTLKNRSTRRRRLSVTGYVEWVLGEHREKTSPFVITEIDGRSGALMARNGYHVESSARVAFFHSSESGRNVTCDRTEFIGRHGSLSSPAGLSRGRFSGRAGAGIDPAAAIRCKFDLAPDEQRELVFVLGAGEDTRHARELAQNAASVGAARQELNRVWEQWNQLLGAVQVETPEPSVNVMVNGWLLYQSIACRFWARSGFYQSGGAYGFRDQLQDSMSYTFAAPWLTREHLLLCASRQFVEGDVQHWWHPPSGEGVRTRISDDFLWLPLAVSRYVRAIGDWGVLDEPAPFLVERRLEQHEEDLYSRPHRSDESASLYEHCCRAIRHGLNCGAHGLPLMGAGDWNDGMNRVGAEGRGESVWLAFFLIKVLRDFGDIAERRQDGDFAAFCRSQADDLATQAQLHAWDGHWFLRAYFDNGAPMGSHQNDECQIDSLPQSWAVIAQAAPLAQLRTAMDAVDQRLVRRESQLIQLFDPPFAHGAADPGYIKGYPPGVRENGGQYTHAAIWAGMAFTLLGETERAWECCRMLNPVNRTAALSGANLYKVEPYVLAADVYSTPPHEGRGGWTWYTGSASWMYRWMLEHLLGVSIVDGARLVLRPAPPAGWTRYSVTVRFHAASYRIDFEVVGKPSHHVERVVVDGVEQPQRDVTLVNDGQPHHVMVTLGVP